MLTPGIWCTFELSLLKIKRTMANKVSKFEPPTEIVERLARPDGFKLQTMTEKEAEKLALKVKAKEELTQDEINMVGDEMLAILATWAQKKNPGYWNMMMKERSSEGVIKNLEKQIEELKNPPKKWYQFWR